VVLSTPAGGGAGGGAASWVVVVVLSLADCAIATPLVSISAVTPANINFMFSSN
jgi:hypothetical protein